MPRNSQHPSPDEIGSIPKIAPKQTTASPSYAVTGGAGGAVGVSQGQQLASALARFNPALQNFGQMMHGRKVADAESHAMQYVDDLEKGVSDHSVIVKKTLREAGASEWKNLHIYRNAIVSTGANFAFRDAQKLETNTELQQQLHQLVKTSSDFEKDAIELIERGTDSENQPFFPLKRNVEEGANKYWEAGYGPSWLDARGKLIAPHQKAHVEQQRTQVRQQFFERGKHLLTNFVTATSENKTEAFKNFRTFLSREYGGYPDGEFGYSQQVFQEVIYPLFRDLAQNPDNDVNIQAAYTKVMSLTRDNENGGRVQMFKPQQDLLTGMAGTNTSQQVLLDFQKMEAGADAFQSKKEAAQIQAIVTKVQPIFRHWDSIKEDPKWKSFLIEKQVHGITDIRDERNWKELAIALADHPDFQMSPKETAEATQRTFLDVFTTVKQAGNQINIQGFTDEKALRTHISAEMEITVGDSVDTLISDFAPEIAAAIGSTSKSVADVKADILKELDPEKLQELWFAKNPRAPKNVVPILSVAKQYANKAVDARGLAAGKQVLLAANEYAANINSSPQSLSDMLDIIRDTMAEVDDSELDSELGSVEKLLKDRLDNSAYYKLPTEDIGRITQAALTADGDEWMVGLLANMGSSAPDPNNPQQSNFGVGDDEWAAGQSTQNFIKQQLEQIRAQEAQKIIKNYDPNQKKTLWAEKGEAEVEQKTISRLSQLRPAIRNHYQDALKKSSSGADTIEAQDRLQLNSTDRETLSTFQSIEDQFLIDEKFGAGLNTKELLAEPGKALEFTAGPAGQMRYNQLKVSKQKREERLGQLSTDLYILKNEHRLLTSNPDTSDAERAGSLKKLTRAEELFKSHYIAFEGIPWKKLASDQGVTIPIQGKLYGGGLGFTGVKRDEKGGQSESVLINPNTDGINFNDTLIYESPEDMESIGIVLNDFEADQGGINAEIDREAAPEELQSYANVIRNIHGHDILDKDPIARKKAHRWLSGVNRKQLVKMYTRHPEKMGDIHAAYEDQALRQFSEGESTSFQGESFTENEKEWVTDTIAQRDSVIDGNLSIEEGLTGKQTVTMFGQLVGGSDNISTTTYEITGDTVGGRQGPKKKPEEVLAQMMALTTVGLQRPITHTKSQEERPGWELGDTGGLFDGTTLALEGRYNQRNRTTLTKAKIAKVQTEVPRILKMLKSKEAEPELARLFNRLVQSEGDFFKNFHGRKNTFGVKPMLIPHAPRPEPKEPTVPTVPNSVPSTQPDSAGTKVGSTVGQARHGEVKPKSPAASPTTTQSDLAPARLRREETDSKLAAEAYAGYREMLLAPRDSRSEFKRYLDDVIHRHGPFDKVEILKKFIEDNPPIGNEPWMQEFRNSQLPAPTPRTKSKKP